MSGWQHCRLVGAVVLAVVFLGCASATRIENEPLARYEPHTGYGAEAAVIPGGHDLRVVLAFSGGGTRAAALAYGVLKELRDTQVPVAGTQRRLLDQITEISSVSGGSFTSAYFGLHGEGIFDDFEDRFLRRDIDARLAVNLIRPLEFLRIAFTRYTRTDMAMDLYDREIFDGATFADLAESKGPALNINATDIGSGSIFTFIQPVFNLICSDLSVTRVAEAVTASSAVPGIFAPLLLENHAGDCGYTEPAWMSHALSHPRENRRLYHDARTAVTYLDARERPYIFLVDGGVADNIGARRIMADVISAGGVSKLASDPDAQIAAHTLFIIVNAQAPGKQGWEGKDSLPSLRTLMGAISSTGIYRYNFETIELLRESVTVWSDQLSAQGVEMHASVVEVAFADLPDAKHRKYFDRVETSFNLSDETIDRLIEVGGQLLRDNPDFKDFLATLNEK